jgi:hypothetical protein
MSLYASSYVPAVSSARQLLETHPACAALVGEEMTPERLERFLIEYTARAVKLTEPVDGWIRRAGAATRAAGLESLGAQLEAHAKHEAGHHLMLIDDARNLAARWNARGDVPPVDVEALLAAPPTPATQAYVDLHEETIASPAPYGQVAIELEIEGLSVRFGPPLMQRVEALLGREVLDKLTFITEHVEVDAGHTALNEKMMARLLADRPDALEDLVRIGRAALEIYVRFFEECLTAADAARSGSAA